MTSSSETIYVLCPQCQATLPAKREQLGTVMTCSNCLEEFVAQAAIESAPAADAPTPSPEPDAEENAALQRLLNPALGDAAAKEDALRLDDVVVDDPPKKKTLVENYEFSVTCPICGTRLDVDDTQIGKKVKCPDCFSKLDVREPPPRARRPHAAHSTESADGELKLEDMPGESNASPALIRSIADELLEKAEQESSPETNLPRETLPNSTQDIMEKAALEVDEAEPARLELPRRPFRDGVARFLVDPNTIAWLVILAIGLFVEFWAIQHAILLAEEEGIQQFLSIIARMFAAIFGIGVGAAFCASLRGILEDTSNGIDKIENWPDISFVDWMGDAFVVSCALFTSIVPAGMIAKLANLVGAPDAVFWMITAVGSAVGGIVLFPFLLLSMLETGSAFTPFSIPIARSVKLAAGHWIKFFLLATVLVVGLGFVGFIRVRWHQSTIINAVSAGAIVLLAAVYFRLLGRLAWCCDEALAKAAAELAEAADADES